MPTAKFTSEPGSPEYHASDWLITLHNAYRELDFAIEKSPNPEEFIDRLREREGFAGHEQQSAMIRGERTRDIAARSLEIVLETL